ncbi:hypothetical protein [Methylobacterium sp. CM6244]
MDTLFPSAKFHVASVRDDDPIASEPSSNWRAGVMAFKWLLASSAKSNELQVKLPGAGTVRVNIGKHVDRALKSQKNEFDSKSQRSGTSGKFKPKG